MNALRFLILFGIAAAVVLFSLAMFQDDPKIPDPQAGTTAGNQSEKIGGAVQTEFIAIGLITTFGIFGIVVVLLLLKFWRYV